MRESNFIELAINGAGRSSLKDPTGLGVLKWLEDPFKEKAPEEATNKAVRSALGAFCVAQNCGKKRGDTEHYGDCTSILNEWIKSKERRSSRR